MFLNIYGLSLYAIVYIGSCLNERAAVACAD